MCGIAVLREKVGGIAELNFHSSVCGIFAQLALRNIYQLLVNRTAYFSLIFFFNLLYLLYFVSFN